MKFVSQTSEPSQLKMIVDEQHPIPGYTKFIYSKTLPVAVNLQSFIQKVTQTLSQQIDINSKRQ